VARRAARAAPESRGRLIASAPPGAGEEPAPLVLPFEAIGAADLPRVGGKGANLGELAAAGFPVPGGFCVTTAAFQRFLAGSRAVAEGVYAALGALEAGDVEGARDAGARVRDRLGRLPMPADVRDAVLAAWQSAGADAAYAVRSSATAEDLPDASFAGQQDTYLNVRGADALLDAVHRCWISLFTDRAILYRLENGFDHDAVSLAVVVQRMVVPAVSGILFTADPLTGNRRVASIDAGFGLGEALVGGLVSADLYRVDKPTGALLEARVADKALAIRPLPDGGTVRQALVGEARTQASLTADQAIALASVGARIEAHFGRPQDIEWVIDDAGATWIVQSRPITSLYPLPQPAPADEALHVYLSFGHAQVMTDAIRPLGRSTLRTLVPFGKDGPPELENDLFAEAGGRLYVDATPLLAVPPLRHALPRFLRIADPLIASALGTVIARPAFGQRVGAVAGAATRERVARFMVPLLARALAWVAWRNPDRAVGALAAAGDARVAAMRADIDGADGLAERVRAARVALGTLFGPLVREAIPVIAGGMLARLALQRLATRDDLNALLRGLRGNVTTEMDLRVGDLADAARVTPEVAEAIANRPPDEALLSLAAMPEAGPFRAELAAFLADYGMRGGSEIDLTRDRWRDDPAPLLRVVAGSLQRDDVGAHRARFAALSAQAEAAAERLVASARHGLLGPLRALAVRRLARVVRGLLAGREHPKFALVRAMDLARLVAFEAGDALVAADRLEARDDVAYLRWDELEAALAQPELDVAGRVQARRAEHARDARRRPPRVMTSDGEVVTAAAMADGAPERALIGTAASGGVYEGVVRLVDDPGATVLRPGEVLVAPFTDPGWTPLFINAGALVMEVGGLMTHGSVVAREYGIPAVVGVVDALSKLSTGQRVRVDGDGGWVEVLGDGNEVSTPT